MFSHEIFQTQMSSVMAAVVEAAVSELSRLLDECATMTSKRCSSPTSHNMIVIKAENGITEEGTQFINPLTRKFASLMETWTKEAVEKIAAMLRMSLAEDGLLEKKTLPRRAKSKTAGGPTKQLPFRRTSGRMRKKRADSDLAERHKDVDQGDHVIPEDGTAAPQPLPDMTPPQVVSPHRHAASPHSQAMSPPTGVPGLSANEEGDEEEEEATAAALGDVDDDPLPADPATPSPTPDPTRGKQSKRSRPDPIQCPLCRKTFAVKCWFERHFVTHSKPHVCSLCGKRFSRAQGLETHALRHTGAAKKLFKCDECDTEFAYKSTYNRHMRRHAVLAAHMLTCAFCEGRFAGALSLQRHACAAVAKAFLCALCPGDGPFASGRALTEHEDALHGAAARDFVCEVCGKSYVSAASLCTHRVAHLLGQRGGEGQGQEVTMEACCIQLVLGCSDAGALQEHLRRKHTTTTVAAAATEFVCEVCGKGCSHRSGLKHHMLTHTGEREFVCETCGKRCSHASALQNHMRVHTGQKGGRKPVCDLCGKQLSSMAKLRYHMSVHRDERPYPCEQCGKRFRNPSNLRKHVISHTGAKPYGCAICGQRFKGALSLKLHGKKHTGERPFSCGQ
ncbi:oocyte zinc finger protein XlCOF6 [Gadus morhua]|uniref:oocyte zinc finger protein XlCOF6 n=1 Tax=Gadus morhua TaxID=8049 RepID=UPI0011B7A27B|nr:oocyte zinc finger protein XlCOF6-like [Gadus morhua]